MRQLPFSKVLVVAPHTDDGEFGCGGLISRLIRQGCEVRYVAFSDCRESIPVGFAADTLANELQAATKCLGVSAVTLLGYKVRYFGEARQAILEDLVTISRDYRPDCVLTPCTMDVHQDHQTVTNEVIRAFKAVTVLGYELPWNNLQLSSQVLLEISRVDLDRKIDAIVAYRSQQGRPYSSPTYIEALAVTRGTRVNKNFAEAFELIRMVL